MEVYSVVQMEVYSVGATAPRSVSSKDCLMVAWTVDTKDGWWVFLVGWMSASSWAAVLADDSEALKAVTKDAS